MPFLKPTQQKAIDAANDPRVSTIVLIGAVGTGKTDVAAHISLSIAYSFPRTYWPVIRQNISTAKRSVIPSYLNMLDLMNLEEGDDYRYNRQDFEIIFDHNGSKIGFVVADVTKDRQGRKIKGINASGNHIDEADELEQTMFITANSRRGRRNEQGQPSLSIVTMNPNDTHLKTLYYDPWKAGALPPDTVVIEFTLRIPGRRPPTVRHSNATRSLGASGICSTTGRTRTIRTASSSTGISTRLLLAPWTVTRPASLVTTSHEAGPTALLLRSGMARLWLTFRSSRTTTNR